MDLTTFPMDSISCILTFESYNYNIQEVRMEWNKPSSLILYKDIQLPDYSLVNYSTTIVQEVGFNCLKNIHCIFSKRDKYIMLYNLYMYYNLIFTCVFNCMP